MKFFFDNNISIRLVRALRELLSDRHVIQHLRDRFRPNTSDIEWIEELARESGWIIVSGDLRITRNRLESEALRHSRLTAFFLAKGWMNRPPLEQAWRLIRWWPGLLEEARHANPGTGFRVPLRPAGKLKRIY